MKMFEGQFHTPPGAMSMDMALLRGADATPWFKTWYRGGAPIVEPCPLTWLSVRVATSGATPIKTPTKKVSWLGTTMKF